MWKITLKMKFCGYNESVGEFLILCFNLKLLNFFLLKKEKKIKTKITDTKRAYYEVSDTEIHMTKV